MQWLLVNLATICSSQLWPLRFFGALLPVLAGCCAAAPLRRHSPSRHPPISPLSHMFHSCPLLNIVVIDTVCLSVLRIVLLSWSAAAPHIPFHLPFCDVFCQEVCAAGRLFPHPMVTIFSALLALFVLLVFHVSCPLLSTPMSTMQAARRAHDSLAAALLPSLLPVLLCIIHSALHSPSKNELLYLL